MTPEQIDAARKFNHERYLARKEKIAAWYEANKETRRAYRRTYYQDNAEKIRAQSAQWHRDNPERSKLQHYRTRYGISLEQKMRILEAQNGRCAICAGVEEDSRKWHLDHCHSTKRVRGVLCHKCNHGLGQFADDVARLQAAIRYLEGNR